MKPFAVVVLSAALVAGAATSVLAQTAPTPAPSTSQQPSASQPSGNGGSTPSASAPSSRTDVNVQTDTRDDSPAASPRGASADGGRILGMSPTAAVILGAALLVVILIALVAMTRGGGARTDTHVDLDRRL